MQTPAFPACPDSALGALVVGLVLTLKDEAGAAKSVLASLEGEIGIELGERHGRWLPLTGTTLDPMELHRRLEALEGVAFVDVAFVEVDGTGTNSQGSPDETFKRN